MATGKQSALWESTQLFCQAESVVDWGLDRPPCPRSPRSKTMFTLLRPASLPEPPP